MPSGGFNPLQYFTGQIMDAAQRLYDYRLTSSQLQGLHDVVVHWLEQAGDLSQVQNPQQFIARAAKQVANNYNPRQGGGGGGNPPGSPPGNPNGGSTGTTPPNPPDYSNYIASYKAILHSWGIKLDKNLENLMANAAHNMGGGHYNYSPWTSDRFMQALRKTKEYKQRFVGINLFPDMTEEQYIAQEQSYYDIADQAHIDINKDTVKFLFRNRVSQSEFADRAQAYGTLQRNKQYFEQFKAEVKAMGDKPPSDHQLLKWIMSKGESNKEWKLLWDAASARYQVTQQGIGVTKTGAQGDTTLSNRDILMIARKISTAQQNGTPIGSVQELADLLSGSYLHEGRMEGLDFDKQDLIEAEFGGPRAAATRQRLKELESVFQARATSSYGATSTQAGRRGLASQQRAQGL